MISVQEALQLVLDSAKPFNDQVVTLENSLGRILAENILADRNYPPFNRAAMDGYAFKSSDVLEKGITEFTVCGELFAGHESYQIIKSGECIKIMTGAATPLELDCIVQVELATIKNEIVTFNSPITKSMNIAVEGEDCKKGDVIFRIGTKLSPVEIGTLAVLGKKSILVKKNPLVAILSTGDELVPVGEPVSPFQIRDSNSYALQAFFQAMGITITKKEIVPDKPEALISCLKSLIEYDLVILSGGVSMGAADYVPACLAQSGVEKIFHKTRLKPGKPIWFGKSKSGTAFFGLPGNPLSCQVCFKLFIEPYLKASFGLHQNKETSFPISTDRKKKVQLDEFFPVELKDNMLKSIHFNGSGDITSTLGSTGIALHSLNKGDISAGENLVYLPWS